jgi:mono/diheme cytochrome c family protein
MVQTAKIPGKCLNYFLLMGVIVMSVSGCSQDQHDHPDLTTGEQLFNYHCAECHGLKGTGTLFDGVPAIILTKKSPGEITAYISSETGHKREMPVFRTMPTDEAQAITDHLITLKNSFDNNGSQIKQLLIQP